MHVLKPLLILLFLLFQLSDFSKGTWHAIRDHVQQSYLIAWDREPDQLCVPAPFSNLHAKRPSQEPPSHFFVSAQLAQSETAVKGQLPIFFLHILHWILVTGQSYVFSSSGQE